MNSSPNQLAKPRKSKSREVSSRYLSPTLSPVRRKNLTAATTPVFDTRKHKSTDHSSGSSSLRGLWPSPGINTNSSNENFHTLVNHLRNERRSNDLLSRKDQKNFAAADCSPIPNSLFSTENHNRPIIGGSMRYSGKLGFSESSSPVKSIGSSHILPRRVSVDDSALSRRKSGSLVDSFESAGSDSSDHFRPSKDKSFSSYMYSTVTSTRVRRGNVASSDSCTIKSDGPDVSPKMRKFTMKNAIKSANMLTRHGSSESRWALAPGRSMESNKKSTPFSNSKPPSSPSRHNGVEKLFNMGLGLFKSKKSSPVIGSGLSDDVHQLRLLQNRLIQWRFVNARSLAANDIVADKAEINLIKASDSITNLRQSVQRKKLQLQKEKLEANLNFILRSQVKLLEAWGDMERQHSSALLKTRDSLHSVVCRVPLIEGAKVDTQSVSIALRHASDLSASINSTLVTFSPEVEKIVELMSELAEVVAHEKCVLEECVELLNTLPSLEIEELSLKCHVIQKSQ